MRLVLIMLATVVAAVWSLPATPLTRQSLMEALSRSEGRNNILEQLLLDQLEALRRTVQQGTDSIPPLDPFKFPGLQLDDAIIPLPGAELSLTDVHVANLATYEVDSLSISMTSIIFQRYRALMDVRIPVLEASAEQYSIDVSALGYNIYGAGNLKVKIVDPKISVNLLLRLRLRNGGMFLDLEECEVKFALGGFEPEITGLFGHDGASDFVNLFLKDFVPSVVHYYEPTITQFLSSNVHRLASEFLADFDITSLINS